MRKIEALVMWISGRMENEEWLNRKENNRSDVDVVDEIREVLGRNTIELKRRRIDTSFAVITC